MMMNNLRNDRTWNRGCETITRSGKRAGKLCNNRFYKIRSSIPNGCQLKSCYMHLEGSHQDVENEVSFYNEGVDDKIDESDFNFIAPEDDGNIIVNGKVFEKEDSCFLSVSSLSDDEETEYEESETETEVGNFFDKFLEEKREREKLELLLKEERFKFQQEQEKLELLLKEERLKFQQEQEKLEDYKRILAESIDNVDRFIIGYTQEVNIEKLKVKSLELEVVELKKLLHKVFQTTNDFQTNMKVIANESVYVKS